MCLIIPVWLSAQRFQARNMGLKFIRCFNTLLKNVLRCISTHLCKHLSSYSIPPLCGYAPGKRILDLRHLSRVFLPAAFWISLEAKIWPSERSLCYAMRILSSGWRVGQNFEPASTSLICPQEKWATRLQVLAGNGTWETGIWEYLSDSVLDKLGNRERNWGKREW